MRLMTKACFILTLAITWSWFGTKATIAAAVPVPRHPGYDAHVKDAHYKMLSISTGGRVHLQADPPASAPASSLATDDPSLTVLPLPPFSAQYQWPAVYFLAAFKGDEVVLAFNDESGKFRLSFDGQPGVMIAKPGHRTIRYDHLGAGYHTIRLETVSVPGKIPGAFDGFFIPAGETVLEPPFSRRQMEFIGDSFAVGIGNHADKRQCSRDEIFDTTNTQDAWGPMTARFFGADYQLNAISGRGIVRNYKGSAGDPIPVVYPFVLFDKKETYRDNAWRPQVIVIALGRNDFLPGVHQGEKWASDEGLLAEVVPAFVSFVKRLRARNPQASFVIMSYDPGIVSNMDQAVVEKLRAEGDTRVGFLEVSGLEETGCGGHPSFIDEQKISASLAVYMNHLPVHWEVNHP